MKKHGRYDVSHLAESQFEPGSRGRVLRNKIGIIRKREMEEIETQALQVVIDTLFGKYDADYRFKESDIKAIHKLWLGEIYEWAGEYRQVNLSKDDFTFAAANQIPKLMSEFEKSVLRKHTPCNFKNHKRIIQALTEAHVEFVLIHPFREGNGRLVRILSTIMASQAGLPILDFADITGRKRKNYFAAIRDGLDRNYEPMEEIFTSIIKRTLKTKTGEKF
jgi:cell filamentation protein